MCTCRSPISLRRNSVLSFFAKYICRTADKCPEKSLVVNLSLQSDSADVITTDVRLTVRDKNYLHGQEFETTYMKSDSLFRESRTQRSNVWTFYVSIPTTPIIRCFFVLIIDLGIWVVLWGQTRFLTIFSESQIHWSFLVRIDRDFLQIVNNWVGQS